MSALQDVLRQAADAEESRVRMAVREVLDKLFWKNYAESHLTPEEKEALVGMIQKYQYIEGCDYHTFVGTGYELEMIERIRVRLGLAGE